MKYLDIKPVSDLRNYNEVLCDVAVDKPVFLTKYDRGRFVFMDIKEYEKMQATIKLMNERSKGEKTGNISV